jgi:hypothetical protein
MAISGSDFLELPYIRPIWAYIFRAKISWNIPTEYGYLYGFIWYSLFWGPEIPLEIVCV